MTHAPPLPDLAIRIRGQVQGVGFRPFVWQLAQAHGVTGSVLNDPEGVLIHARGATAAFLDDLRAKAPPLARVDGVETAPFAFPVPPQGFLIAASTGVGARTRVTPDAAACPDCLAEIRDPADRRYGYPFANCTHCGPRLSILDRLPYDRAQTSMAAFEMCPACRAEYEDPGDRRFHAQPVACPACGPRAWVEAGGVALDTDPLAEAARRLADGQILAIKGIGGFHLACDATNAGAIGRLRERKRRPAKPLALMAPLHILRRHAAPDEAELARLTDAAAPIVLLPRSGARLPDGLAPGQPTLGWMLPYTPLHHLIFDRLDVPLVMTSGNLSGEPQVIGNDEARAKLLRFADALVLHDRDIRRRLDDSVERVTPHGPMVLRRGRGRVPGTLPLPPGFEAAPDTLATGGDLKGAICLAKTGQALLSHHLGDLDDALSFAEARKAVADYRDLFDHAPTLIAADLHKGYRATGLARGVAEELDLPLVAVQHHHAHLAACLGEHLWPRDGGPVAGIILDGLGLGADGTIWGGEVLIGDYERVSRRAWLKPVPLIGGDAAGRMPWRNLLARLDDAGRADEAEARLAGKPLATLRKAAALGTNAPLSSSAGRLFDAYAAFLGIAPEVLSFEGEAAMALEALALTGSTRHPVALPVDDGVIDPAPLFDPETLQSADPACLAHGFHAALARAFADVARRAVGSGDARAVVLSGGCFQNALLLDLTIAALAGIPVLHHRETPANDGGLALGQALVAMAQAEARAMAGR
ncbi:carbamoyltransferase HypF [Roseibacterium sp. SDUM158016]|uniref:carbamoyltransferase HypF n=1 Tax=Roseicyclus sediminis TaxID=2980997 RepID=UPI0021D03E75|nr:carbamoyltransferase HypF [Roseibacterium sp. SDUM158016]MCU4654570.1 carbamoyltransferase HypF [Roseibacterium sp. SDUM158016]